MFTMTIDQARGVVATLASVFASSDAPTARRISPGYVSPLAVTPALVIPDTLVGPTDRRAVVTVTLSEPANRPLSWRCLTSNGTAYAGGFYTTTQATVLFQPGETAATIEVPIVRPLGDKTFKIDCVWSNNNPAIKGASGTIRSGVPVRPRRAAATIAYPPAARTAGRTLAFASTFAEPIVPDIRRGTWRSRFDWGRVQIGNKEIAPYTDRSTDPGVDPHPIVDGKRVLRAEHVPVTNGGTRYAYSASLIDSANLFTFRYGYIEARVKFARAQGTVAAFWLIPANDHWPPEIDIFETGLGDNPAAASSIHFANDGIGGTEGVMLPRTVEDGRWHVIGFDWTPAWQVTFIDGVEVLRRRNQFDVPMKIVFDVSVGGLGPDPKAPGPGWTSELALDYVKVWR